MGHCVSIENRVPLESTTEYARHGQWQAFLNLDFAQTTRGTRLVRKSHRGPLYIQRPFYPEGQQVPHAYLLHPPGGLVSGDSLSIGVDVQPNAHVLVTTPGAGRVYRSREAGTMQRQVNELKVADAASLEWMPLESILFPDAQASIDTRIELQGSGKIITWDILSLGLPANAKGFDSGALNQNLTIWHDGRLLLQERLRLDDTNRALLSAAIGLRNQPIQGLMLAGPFTQDTADLIARMREQAMLLPVTLGITSVHGFVLVRALHQCTEQTRQALETMWALLRPALLGRAACAPRIWKT